jgi:cytoskeleton protein RodZ
LVVLVQNNSLNQVKAQTGMSNPATGSATGSAPDPAQGADQGASARQGRPGVSYPSSPLFSAPFETAPAHSREAADIIRKRPAKLALVPNADERIGCALRRRREDLGISLTELSEETKIRRSYIDAIEQMDLKALPGTTYVTGYLKTISAELSLDAPEVLERFRLDCAMLRDGPVRMQRAPKRHGVPMASIMFGLIVGAVCALLVWRWVDTGLTQGQIPATQLADEAIVAAGGSAPILADVEPLAVSPRTVLLRARSETWLEVRGADGTVFISRTLEPGETYAPRLDAGWSIFARDADQFEWVVGDKVIGHLGLPGEPIFGARVGALLVAAETRAAEAAALAAAKAEQDAARANRAQAVPPAVPDSASDQVPAAVVTAPTVATEPLPGN